MRYHRVASLSVRVLRKGGFADALHVILARDNNAILVTRDEHFIDLTVITRICFCNAKGFL